MPNSSYYPRFSEGILKEAIEDSPVVLIHGSRQCGKTTMAKHVGKKLGYHYITFDDETQKKAAQLDPSGFVNNLPEFTILDEIQHVPELFSAIKVAVDTNRKSGRFILTGSSNILLLPKLSDSLAGRMEIIRLRPLALVEVAQTEPHFITQVFNGQLSQENNQSKYQHLGEKLAENIVAGGYPAALLRKTQRRRSRWYRDYISTIVQRDIQELAHIQKLDVLPRLLSLAAGQTARLFNASVLASPFSISRPTIRQYLTLLEQLFLIEQLPPYHNNRLSRLIKTPKLHMADTGLACSLLGLNSQSLWKDRNAMGQLLETFIYQELRKYADWQEIPVNFYHYRNKDKVEVDIIMQQGSKFVGIEIKASATVRVRDFKGLNQLKQATGQSFCTGVVFYDGENIIPFGDKMFAVPISLLIPEI